MDKDARLTSFLLHYLQNQGAFSSKREMADALNVTKRLLQRLMNEPDKLKRGSESLGKVLCYFAVHKIPLDAVLAEYLGIGAKEPMPIHPSPKEAAYQRIWMSMPQNLSAEMKETFFRAHRYICLLSQYICPTCSNWCNPWEQGKSIEEENCLLAKVAKNITDTIRNSGI